MWIKHKKPETSAQDTAAVETGDIAGNLRNRKVESAEKEVNCLGDSVPIVLTRRIGRLDLVAMSSSRTLA
jgi:hypothetical protein